MFATAGPDYTIETFHAKDLVPVLGLVQRSLGEEIPYQFFLQMASLKPAYCLVARAPADGSTLGVIVGTREPGQAGRVLVLAVDPSAQGRGVGKGLLQSLQASMTLESIRQLHLEVRADNARAIDFYQRHGFHVTGLQERAYKDGAAAFEMMKPLR